MADHTGRPEKVSAVMDYYDGSWGAGQWLVMSLMMLLFWGGLVALIVWAVRASRGHEPFERSSGSPARTPAEVLADRFARGEIDADEFQRSRDLLTSTTRSR